MIVAGNNPGPRWGSYGMSEEDVVGAGEIDGAAQPVRAGEHRAVSLHRLEAVERTPGQRISVDVRVLDLRTPSTITTPDRLRATLEQVRRQGYALLAGHVHPDAAGIAVPVQKPLGEVAAALSVIVANDPRAVSAVPALLAAARGIGRSLRCLRRAS